MNIDRSACSTGCDVIECNPETIPQGHFNLNLWKSRRYFVTFMGTLGFFNLYALRGSFSVALVAMTQLNNVTIENGTVLQVQEFEWDSRQRGLILGSFFYGYIWTQIIGGILSARYGGHMIFGWGIGISAILAIFSLVAARLGIYSLITVRFLVGICQGVGFPSIQDIYYNWAPIYERTTISAFVQNGSQLGAFTSFLLSGYLIEYFGWESVFYVFGGFGFIWFLLWIFYIKRDPASDPRISVQEKSYIESNTECIVRNSPTPWKSIFTCRAIWAQFFPSACDAWISFTYITQIPSYLMDVLKYDLGTIGFYTAAPYLFYIIITPFFSIFSDWLRYRKILSTTNVRKVNIVAGFSICIICLLVMSNSTNSVTILSCLIVMVASTGLIKISYFVNPQDLAPNHGAVIMGISNSIATIPGIVAPTLTGFIVRDGTPDEWKIVFYITAVICFIGMVVFAFFGEGEIQEWAKDNSELSKECKESLYELRSTKIT